MEQGDLTVRKTRLRGDSCLSNTLDGIDGGHGDWKKGRGEMNSGKEESGLANRIIAAGRKCKNGNEPVKFSV